MKAVNIAPTFPRRYLPLRTCLLLVATAMLAGQVHAQTKTQRADIEWGDLLDDKKDGDFRRVIDRTGDAVYQLMYSKKDGFLVQRMDLDMRPVYRKPIELEMGKDELELEDVHIIGRNIVVFASSHDKRNDERNLFVKVYAAADMGPVSMYTKVARMDVESRRNRGAFNTALSPDSSKVLLYVQKPFEKNEKDRFAVKVFDASLSKLWEADIEMPYTDKEFVMEEMQVDNDGSVVCVGVKYASPRERRELKRSGGVPYDYHVLVYWKGQAAPVDETIKVEGKFLQDLTLSLGKDGDILCAGFYSDKGSWSIRGTFFLRIDRVTKSIVHQSFKEFDKEFITAYMTEKEKGKAERKAERKGEEVEMMEYDVRDIIRREDGGALVLAEQYYWWVETVRTTNANGTVSTRVMYHYVYNDIIVVNIAPGGDIEWAAKVPKRQHSINDAGYNSSFAANLKGGKVHLIFNDSGSNLFLKEGDRVAQFEVTGKDALVTLVTVDEDGITHREALFSPERRDAKVCPKDCVQLVDGRTFLYASRKKEYRFGMVTFD
ncbi:MAG: hypothetical protein JNL05_02595 [Flavobacteriales bacterium]|nr:hypothetical protein [Flavobacteriales bacterium]